ncbi:MAG: ATP-binding protein [Clostridiales Family XIII bacterium]|jgi:Na+-driven multidrug efflux pump|nr:ATP-binding protein [Clostridiales Family XIII bacterium]
MVSTVRADALKPNDAFIGKVVVRYLAPSVLSMIGTRISSMANGLILGNFIGENGLAALSIVSPVSLAYLSLGALIGVGASIVSGVALGRGDMEACNRAYTLAYASSLLAGFVMMLAGVFFAGGIASVLGAKGDIFPLARDYIRVAALGGLFTVLLYTPLNYLRLCGKPNHAMALLLIMSFANTGFSAFFVMALGMRTAGVALGGCAGSLLAWLFGAYCLWGPRSELRVGRFRFVAGELPAVLRAGRTPALSNICRSAQYMFLNLMFVRVAPRALPAYAVVCAAQDMLLAVVLGFSQILLPLASFSYGEKDGRCIRAVTKRILLIGNLAVGACALLLLAIRGHVGLLFGIRDAYVLEELNTALCFMALGANLSFINNTACNYFNVTRRGMISLMTTLCRLLVFPLIPAYALAGSMGARAVWISIAASEFLTALALVAAILAVRARDANLSRLWLLPDSFAEKPNILDFSVENTSEAAAFASARIVDFCEANAVRAERALRLSLAIEEMLLLINEHSQSKRRKAFADLRVTVADGELTLRIRNAGARFNPLQSREASSSGEDENPDAYLMGMDMILKMAKKVEYMEIFGVNNLTVTI